MTLRLNLSDPTAWLNAVSADADGVELQSAPAHWYVNPNHTCEVWALMAITASEARKNLFPLIEQVNNDRAPVEITSKRGRAVLIAADEWEAWQETAYLFRSPANARRLLDAAEALDQGRGLRAELDDE